MYRLVPLLLLLVSTAGLTTTVYKTVDKNGVVNFSDTPPEDQTALEVLQISPATPQPAEDHLERLATLRETTDRMAADRREREKHRAELNEIKARTQSYQEPVQPDYTDYTSYYPIYGQRYRHTVGIPWRPGFRPQPEHPIVRPPLRPGHEGIGSSNSQLMRPLVSSRR